MKIFIPAIVIIGVSFIIIVQGELFKIMHWPMANELLVLGFSGIMIGLLIGLITLVYYILRKDNDSKK